MDETSRKIEKVYGVLFLQSCCPHGPLFGPVTHDVFHFPTCFHLYSAIDMIHPICLPYSCIKASLYLILLNYTISSSILQLEFPWQGNW